MNPRVKSVKTLPHYQLEVTFDDGQVREFDVKPYLDKGFFGELKDEAYFNSVTVSMGTVQWPHGQDFCPDTLFEDSIALSSPNL